MMRRRPTPLEVLLVELDRIATTSANYGPTAADQAAQVRTHGQRAVHHLLGQSAGHVVGCRSLLDFDPVLRAWAAYDLATTGTDWHRVEGEHIRARRRVPSLAVAIARRDATIARVAARAQQRHRAALRSLASN